VIGTAMIENDSIVRDKIDRLLKYLQNLASIRSKLVRDIKEYPFTLWFHAIPSDSQYCYCHAWGPNEEFDDHIWIEVRKYDEPLLDEVPKICSHWIDSQRLYNTDEIPELFDTLTGSIEDTSLPTNLVVFKDDDQDDSNLITIRLEDNPQIQQEWEKYIEMKWFPWRDVHKKWEAVNDIYCELFTINQQQQKLGEEFELVLGVGLLTWKTPSGHKTRRHLLTANVNLIFDASGGKFTVSPAVEGAQLSSEFDMLDISDHPIEIIKNIDSQLVEADDNPWNRSVIDPVLAASANSLSDKGQGKYYPKNFFPSEFDSDQKPIVDFAPALILRKRSVKGLEKILRDIQDQVLDGGVPTPQFLDLCESYNPDDNDNKGKKESFFKDESIYFPLDCNEEQEQIVQKMFYQNGLLVLGPPGTGKSHTIANLICHCLASGKRILVTAKTPRALQVLHDKIPEKIKPLCINLLGTGIEEQQSLEDSVGNILIQSDIWRENIANESKIKLKNKLSQLKSDQAKVIFDIKTIHEKETLVHSICNNSYKGTAAQIAKKVKQSDSKYLWFEDSINDGKSNNWSSNEIVDAIKFIKKVPDKIYKYRNYKFLDNNKLFSEYELSKLIEKEKKLKDRIDDNRNLIESSFGKLLIKGGPLEVESVISAISELASVTNKFSQNGSTWIKSAACDILKGVVSSWNELSKSLSENIKGLKERSKNLEKVVVSIPDDTDKNRLMNDAKTLQEHFSNGGKIGWGIFKPKTIKQNEYILKNVYVNSSSCDNLDTINTLIEYLDIEYTIDYCWGLIETVTMPTNGPFFMQIASIEEIGEKIEKVLSLKDYISKAKEKLKTINDRFQCNWSDFEAIDTLNNTCTAVSDLEKLKLIQIQIESRIADIIKITTGQNFNPAYSKIVSSIEQRNIDHYKTLISYIDKLKKYYKNIESYENVLKDLNDNFPILTSKIKSDDLKIWRPRIEALNDAINWHKANAWIENFLSEDDLPSLISKSNRIDSDINETITELVFYFAWQFCFERMEEYHRRHLLGWQQDVKKMGKGTGRHALKHRRDAQAHLNKCRSAIPAWIMPLHRVYESVQASPGAFDVIIVDEASQCGFDALPLTYFAKQLVVVGDENQISPEAPGVNKDLVFQLMKNYLFDFEHKDSFDIDTSFFAHCKRRFTKPIVLREHFRCMPEIIRFSNDLCYSATPLIPLKQYPPKRLEPLQVVHVEDGYREGANNQVVNKPEAEALVDAVVNCCNDDRYENKTMGVIILQGQAQAMLIENMLLKAIDAEEIQKRRLISGNPYSFQGDERDIIFLSMVAARNKRIGPFTGEDDKRRFNVAASRAKEQMWLFHTPLISELSHHCLRRRLLNHFQNPNGFSLVPDYPDIYELEAKAHKANRQIEKPPKPFDSWFEVDVTLKIAHQGFRVVPQYPVLEKKRIDIVVEGLQARLAVECDGDYWHGPDNREKDMERQRILERCGWQFFRVRESAFYLNPDVSLEGLWELLDELSIRPISDVNDSINNEIVKEPNNEKKFADKKNEKMDNISNNIKRKSHIKQQSLFDEVNSESKNSETINNIQDALSLPPAKLRYFIIETLKERPNFSCVKEQLGDFVIKYLNIITRGKPRQKFKRKINSVLNYMQRKEMVKIYKTSKNVRVKIPK
jgi:very-short-patch-repair endonuclease